MAHSKQVQIIAARSGLVWSSDDGVVFRFLGPTVPFITGSRNDINENSVVFMLEYRCLTCARSFRMLFTGDAGAEAEHRLLDGGVDLHADVLKVGHHGSAYGTMPEFVRAAAPRYAIISVGRDNLFGHPAPQTLETLRDQGAQVFRTDENGSIAIATDGKTERLSTILSGWESRQR